MNLVEGIRLLACFAYALIPYSALYLFARHKNDSLDSEDVLSACLWGIVGFVLVAIPIAYLSLNLYCIVHAALCIPAVIWLVNALRRNISFARSFRWVPVIVLSFAFVVRLAPFLPHDHWYGAGDMRFHNILAKSIILSDSLPRNWEPFASIAVNYPLGGHLMAAFVSLHSRLPVHTVLNVLLCLYGSLSAALIYFLAYRLFSDRFAAAASSMAYAFIALAGSLDYIRWGGIPNAMAMLLLLLFVMELLRKNRDSETFNFRDLAPALVAAAVVLIHHYSALAMFLLVGSLIVFSPLRASARTGLTSSLAGLLLALLILRAGDAIPGTDVGNTSVFRFYEHPISLAEALMSLNMPFAVISIAGVLIILRRGIPRSLSLVTAWITGYFAAFVLLQYVYRLAVFTITDGHHFFTALTPSRLIADLAYPLSLAAGALLTQRPLADYKRHCIGVLSAAGMVSCLLFFLSLQGASATPGADGAIRWITANVPADSIIVGSLPHLEYRAWRRTSAPPIPASEARNHPELIELRTMNTIPQWRAYATDKGLNCYYVLAGDQRGLPPGIKAVYSSEGIIICTGEEEE